MAHGVAVRRSYDHPYFCSAPIPGVVFPVRVAHEALLTALERWNLPTWSVQMAKQKQREEKILIPVMKTKSKCISMLLHKGFSNTYTKKKKAYSF